MQFNLVESPTEKNEFETTCKKYHLTIVYNSNHYEKIVDKYDFTSNFVKLKNITKILGGEKIAHNITSNYTIEENKENTFLRLNIDLTIQKINKKLFENIEIFLQKKNISQSQHLILLEYENRELYTKNYQLNSQYQYELGYQKGYSDYQDFHIKTVQESIKKLKRENDFIKCSSNYIEENLVPMIQWREIVQQSLNSDAKDLQ
jgi:hypothetical protein